MTALAWYVGDNQTGGVTALINPAGKTNGYQAIQAGNAADNAQFAAAAKANKGSASPNTISVENISWYNIQGPWATEVQAKAAIPAIQAKNAAPGEVSQIAQGSGPLAAVGKAVSDPLDYLADVGDFFHRLTEAATWERVGEIAAGVILLYVGIKAVTQQPGAAKKSGGTFKKIVEAAAVVPK